MLHTHHHHDAEGGDYTHSHGEEYPHTLSSRITWNSPPVGPCSTKIHEDSAYRIFLGSTGRITVEGKVTPRCPNAKPSWVVLWQSR